jgi:hypothetical protein
MDEVEGPAAVAEFGLQGSEFLITLREACAKRFNLGEQRGHVLPLRFRMTDRLRASVAFVAQRVHCDLGLLAPRLQGAELGQVEREPAPREVRGDALRIAAQLRRWSSVPFLAADASVFRAPPSPRGTGS